MSYIFLILDCGVSLFLILIFPSRCIMHDTEGPTKMRKFYRLLGYITAVISFLCALIYKHKYDHLVRVIEVLNIYGESPNFNQSSIPSPKLDFLKVYSRDTSGVPRWTLVSGPDGDIFLYSAYGVDVVGDKFAIPVYLVSYFRNIVFKPTDWMCHMTWDDGVSDELVTTLRIDEDLEQAVMGAESQGFHIIRCILTIRSLPHHVRLVHAESKKSSERILVKRQELPKYQSNNHVICMSPAYKNPVVSMAEFIAFHSIIGFHKFFYYNAFPSDEVSLISVIVKSHQVHYTELPWNFPHWDMFTQDGMVMDCFLRNMATARSITVLNPSQLLIPKSSDEISTLLVQPINAPMNRIKFSIMGICVTQTDEEDANPKSSGDWLKIFKPSRSFDTKTFATVFVLADGGNFPLKGKAVSTTVKTSTAAVHEYGICDSQHWSNLIPSALTIGHDNSMFRWKNQILNHPLVKDFRLKSDV